MALQDDINDLLVPGDPTAPQVRQPNTQPQQRNPGNTLAFPRGPWQALGGPAQQNDDANWDVPPPPAPPVQRDPDAPVPPPAPAGPTATQRTSPVGGLVPSQVPGYTLIQDAYRRYLGRNASDAEVMSHLDYGRATSRANVDFAVRNIQNSPEARAYAQRSTSSAPTTPTSVLAPGQYTSAYGGYEQSRLNSAADNDPKTVWGRYAYTVTEGGKRAVTAEDMRNFVAQDPRWEIGGSPDHPYLRVKQSELDKWKPGTSTWQDVLGGGFTNAAGDPAQGYAAWNPGAGARSGNTSEFSDPWGSRLEDMVNERLRQLGLDPAKPNLKQYMDDLLKQKATEKQRATDFAATLNARADELKAPPYTAGDEAGIRARAFDALERRRTATLKNQREDIYGRGFAPSSGLVQDSNNRVNDRFEQSRTGIESGLMESALQEGQRRKNQALSLQGLAQQALEGGDLNSLRNAQMLSDLENQQISEANARAREGLATVNLPLDLMDRRTRQATNILDSGSGGDPMSTIMQLLNAANSANQTSNQNSQANNQNWGNILAYLGRIFGLGGSGN